MRVVSLAPNITEIIRFLERGSDVVACTQHDSLDSAESIGGWLSPDYNKIEEVDPDIVFTSDPLQRDIRDELKNMDFTVHHTEPRSFSDLVPLIVSVGDELDVDDIDNYTSKIIERVESVRGTVTDGKTIYCEEWDKPPMVAGNWVPEMIDTIGGSYPFCDPTERSKEVTEEEFVRQEPDLFISHICGQGTRSTFREFREKWDYSGYVYFVNDSCINQLSPRTIDGLELLAEIASDQDYGQSDMYVRKRYENCF